MIFSRVISAFDLGPVRPNAPAGLTPPLVNNSARGDEKQPVVKAPQYENDQAIKAQLNDWTNSGIVLSIFKNDRNGYELEVCIHENRTVSSIVSNPDELICSESLWDGWDSQVLYDVVVLSGTFFPVVVLFIVL